VTGRSWQAIQPVLRRALDLREDERAIYLHSVYAAQPEWKEEIESMLRLEPAVTPWATRSTPPAVPASLIGRQLGAYRVVAELGSGGMGLVYRARREDGQFEKDVAIKVLYWGLYNESLAGRFQRERQLLAKLDHENITRLLDSGVSDEGLPYLVMELVDGVPVNAYCQKQALGLHAIALLLAEICDAVHYAHQNLVIHRDLKPGNILVRKDDRPKLLDFGVAKWLEDATVAPDGASGWAPFTPRYASPEQIRGGVITTATDVYSIGVILSELAGNARDADIQAIVRKATQPEPSDRYRSSAELGSDLRAYAGGRPVKARQWSVMLAVTKWVRRHPLTAAMIVLNTAVILTLGVRYQTEYMRANQRSRDLREIATAIVSEINSALVDLPRSTAVRQRLAATSLRHLDRLRSEGDDPLFLSDVAEGYFRLAEITGNRAIGSAGDFPAAIELHRRAEELIRRSDQALPRNNAIRERYVRILISAANIQPAAQAKESILRAEKLFEELKARAPESNSLLLLEGKLYDVRGWIVNGFGSKANRPYAERMYVAYQKLAARVPENLSYQGLLGHAMVTRAEFIEDFDTRVREFMKAVDLRRRMAATQPQNTWYQLAIYMALVSVAEQYRLAGLPAKALPYYRDGIVNARHATELDPDDAGPRGWFAFALGDLAALEIQNGNRREAEAAAREGIRLADSMLAKDPKVFRPNWGLGHAYRALGDLGGAEACANYAKAAMYAKRADESIGGRNPAVRTLIGDVERAQQRCGTR